MELLTDEQREQLLANAHVFLRVREGRKELTDFDPVINFTKTALNVEQALRNAGMREEIVCAAVEASLEWVYGDLDHLDDKDIKTRLYAFAAGYVEATVNA